MPVPEMSHVHGERDRERARGRTTTSRHPGPWQALCALLTAVLLCASPAHAGEAPAWSALVLPGGRAGLLPALGMDADAPRGIAVGEIIRTVHADRGTGDGARAALTAYLASLPADGDEMLPVPLPAAAWQALLAQPVPDRQLLGAILTDRKLALLCQGLVALDNETLTWIGGQPDLLERIRDRYAGVFAAFGGAFAVRQGVVGLPGGDGLASAWRELGVPADDPARAMERLFGTDGGRLAYFAATLEQLEPARRLFLVGREALPEATRRHLVRSSYAAFKAIDPGWRANDFPYTRPGFDPALLAASIELDAEGRLAGTRTFWQVALEREAMPGSTDPSLSGGEATAGWLLGEIARLQVETRRERFHLVHYVQRQRRSHATAAWRDLARLAQAFRRFPALMLTLERIGVGVVALQLAIADQAEALDRWSGSPGDREVALALFQAPIALVDAAVRGAATGGPELLRLLQGLIHSTAAPDARRLAAWFDTAFLPALGHDPSLDVPAESVLLEALAGFAAAAPDRAERTIEWEGQTYRLDAAAPELVRLTDVRQRQGGNTLDAALELARIGSLLASAATLEDLRAPGTRLERLQDTLAAIQVSERPGSPAPPDVRAAVTAARAELASFQNARDLSRLAPLASRLGAVENAVMADVLTSIVYALAIGPVDSRMFLAGNVARRHEFGTRERPLVDRAPLRWALPQEASGDGAPWHVRGSLLALDVGLSHLRLRRTGLDMPENRPTLVDMDRRALTAVLALLNPLAPDRDGARALVGWLAAGRASLGRGLSASAVAAIAARLDLRPDRRRALAWTAVHDPESVPRLLLLTEIALVGRPASAAPPPSAWGTAPANLTGCLCLEFPSPPALHRYTGRASDGLWPTRIADLTLVVLEGLIDRDLPVGLTRGVLQSALYDFIHDVQLGHSDDFWSYSWQTRVLSGERLVDYISALTAGGALVPAPAAASRP